MMIKKCPRTYQVLVILAFSLPVLAPWIYVFYDNNSISSFDEKPRLSFKAIEQRISHELVLLKKYETVRAWIRYRLLNLTPSKYFLLANDGWFFRNHGNLRSKRGVVKMSSLLEDHMGYDHFSQSELKRWGRILNQRYHYLRKRGIKYVFTIAPRKSEIYPEAFDVHIRQRFRKTKTQQLLTYLMQHTDVPIVDLRSYLKQIRRHRPKSPALYFKTDGHWNMLGAYWAYHGIMSKVGNITSSSIRPVSLAKFRIKWLKNWHHQRFAKLTGLAIAEPYPFFIPIRNNPLKKVIILKKRDRYLQVDAPLASGYSSRRNSLVKRGIGRTGYPTTKLVNSDGVERSYVMIKNKGDVELDTILVMGDSFGKRLLYFLSAHAKRTFRYREMYGFDPHLLSVPIEQRGKIELVIQEIGQGAIARRIPDNPPVVRVASS